MTDFRIHYNTQVMKDQHDNKESKERNEGPEVTTKYSCVKCKYETSESYRCQGDSGHDVYCTHPSFPVRRRIGDTTWRTPEFCPFRQQTDQNASQETSLLREENERLKESFKYLSDIYIGEVVMRLNPGHPFWESLAEAYSRYKALKPITVKQDERKD
jgi:hypothetical protein